MVSVVWTAPDRVGSPVLRVMATSLETKDHILEHVITPVRHDLTLQGPRIALVDKVVDDGSLALPVTKEPVLVHLAIRIHSLQPVSNGQVWYGLLDPSHTTHRQA